MVDPYHACVERNTWYSRVVAWQRCGAADEPTKVGYFVALVNVTGLRAGLTPRLPEQAHFERTA